MSKLKILYKKIISLKDLRPNEKTNRLFSELVSFAVQQKKNDLSKAQMLKLQELCSLAEFELEKYWADKITSARYAQKSLKSFPYFSNYERLTQLEWLSLLGCTSHAKHKILFIGGGPLPMTAFFLAKNYGQKVTVLEKDRRAFLTSTGLCKKLGLDKKVCIIHADAKNFTGYKNYNAFFAAALAGTEGSVKHAIISKIQREAPRNSHVLARSSWGSREILYKPLELKNRRIKTVVEVRPHNDVVNSFYIFHV